MSPVAPLSDYLAYSPLLYSTVLLDQERPVLSTVWLVNSVLMSMSSRFLALVWTTQRSMISSLTFLVSFAKPFSNTNILIIYFSREMYCPYGGYRRRFQSDYEP